MEEDVYAYTLRNEFTSEIFKIEINNIPKFLTPNELKKLFINKFKILPKKVKIIKNNNKKSLFAFVTFQNISQRDMAIKLADGYIYKNYELKVFKASLMKDPIVKKKLLSKDTTFVNYDNYDDTTLKTLILEKICPLWQLDYQSQLNIKEKISKEILCEILNEIKNLHKISNNDKYLDKIKIIDDIFLKINYHTVTNNYRNKCEFSIGMNKEIGFRLGSYKNNNVKVIKPPSNCIILNDRMLNLLDVLDKFFSDTILQPFNIKTHTGHINQITIRTSKNNCMLIISLYVKDLKEDEIANEFLKLNNQLKDKAPFVTSFYIQKISKKLTENDKKMNILTHMFGDYYIIEQINLLKFRISPFAFFQINVNAAEILYETILDLANLNKNVVLLDICCGIGTIGIYLSNKVKFVIGIELMKEAIEDARFNARLNNIENIEFFNGKAEENIKKILKKEKELKGEEIVTILNPPRAGLNNNIIKSIRNCIKIKKLIYVSCEPKLAKQNLVDLCRPVSKAYQGTEFQLDKVRTIDMFPHTDKFEMVLLYTR